MGVHNANYKKVKKELGIDESEPIFVIRAQDDLACAIITRYLNMASQIEDEAKRPSDDWFRQMGSVLQEFNSFRAQHPDKIKVPD